MENAFLITGNTYTSRREIKALGGKWYPDRTGWIVPTANAEPAKALALARGFEIEEIQVEPQALEHPTGERLRAIRQARLDKKIERWRGQADRREQQAAAVETQIKPYDDYAFWTEPVKTDHYSAGRHTRLREKLRNKDIKRLHLTEEARQLREKADTAERSGARIAGDAARRDQAIREQRDQAISVGSRVTDVCFGEGEVVRVHRKSYTVKWDRGSTFSRDKIFVRPIAA